jgi:hypothetical protein
MFDLNKKNSEEQFIKNEKILIKLICGILNHLQYELPDIVE